MTFKDHFSIQSEIYAKYRPTYPTALFDYLESVVPETGIVWDCAAGSGQCAAGLKTKFPRIIATDASQSQIVHATYDEKISYLVSTAEKAAIRSNSVDLITVAQSLHWFRFEEFYSEVRRILKPDGVLAAWCYTICQVTPQIDKTIFEFYYDLLGPYWDSARFHVDGGYASIPFPFVEIETLDLIMQSHWDFLEFVGYISTWSAVQKYKQQRKHNPITMIYDRLLRLWGHEETPRKITWPIHLRVGRIK